MATGISAFKSNFNGGGARPNLFRCTINFPEQLGFNGGDLRNTASFLIKAASLPASVIAPIEVPFRGRKLKIAGDRTFEPWSITVINDTNFKLRNAFEKWMNAINNHEANVTSFAASLGQSQAYFRDLAVTQLDRNGADIGLKTYEIKDAFPTNVSAIELNYETNDAVEEFTVEFQYQYWTAKGITT
jgi:hypothetical protein